ncbi:MAG: hypothetical protein Kow00129_06580 [Thermoleophilia bacterium]
MRFTTALLEKIPRIGDVTTFRFDKPGSYEYRAGQWGVIDIPSTGGTLSHHFTHASSPTEPYLDITTHVRETEFKKTLDRLQPGTEVQMKGPFGQFYLRDEHERAAFVTGGIGITPVRSILRDLADSGAESPEIVVFYANRRLETAVYRDELDALDDQLPFLEIIHVPSEPAPDWQGQSGHIDRETITSVLENPADWIFYLCGPPGMVKDMRELLRTLSIANNAILAETFDGYE